MNKLQERLESIIKNVSGVDVVDPSRKKLSATAIARAIEAEMVTYTIQGLYTVKGFRVEDE